MMDTRSIALQQALNAAQQHRAQIHQFIRLLVILILTSLIKLLNSLYNHHPKYTSILTGHAWVLELLVGHPDHIQTSLGINQEVFLHLVSTLHDMGLSDSRHVTLEEQVAIFLHGCVTGLPIRHLAERFQQSNDTISKYVLHYMFLSCDLMPA